MPAAVRDLAGGRPAKVPHKAKTFPSMVPPLVGFAVPV
jgi:hypothetical protein